MGGGDKEKAEVIQTILFVAGLNTLVQSIVGTRLPAVIGPSRSYILPALSIIYATRYNFIFDPHQRFLRTMRGIQGALIISSFFQIIFGFLGFWRTVVWLLSPLSAVPLITLVGLGLYQFGFPVVASCIEVGLPELVLLIIISQYIPRVLNCRRAVFERFAVLISVAIVWAYAAILTVGGAYNNRSTTTQMSCRTDRSGLLTAAPWIKFPYPFQWGTPTFQPGEAFAMMAASFVALIESTGTFIAVSRFGSATHIPASVLCRGIGWQGIGLLLDGLFGTANGSTASVENAGLLGLTRVGSRRVVQIAACFMLFFAVIGKFGALFASIPIPIVAALYCILFAYTGSAGIGLLQFCNLNSFRTKFILGFSLFMGFSVPHYFNVYFLTSGRYPVHTGSTWFNDVMNVIFLSNATVGVLVALILDCTLNYGDSVVRRDCGDHWWEKFRYYKTDARSEEFYSLPYSLNKYFPSV
ncbi:Nucleobase-ascorbate transporter [Thalictrum thalictroides]|uniref:Nucleobase-ascorbate transporter n=1 Tax=Thalictrum thalictroides TaxID=46969 RepID=A0A7J6X923_THATH|nr:Nucleobase-ascorbate transporter [Thalictrum thalictroides]